MVGMCAAMTCVFVPVIARLNTKLKVGRATVLQFPNDVIRAVPAMHALVMSSARSAGTSKL